MKISNYELDQITQQVQRRNTSTMHLGVATGEYELHKHRLMGEIAKSTEIQQALGEQALRALGLDPMTGDFRIAKDGTVVRLKNGLWVDHDTGEPVEGLDLY